MIAAMADIETENPHCGKLIIHTMTHQVMTTDI
jgi:hypothetical protein